MLKEKRKSVNSEYVFKNILKHGFVVVELTKQTLFPLLHKQEQKRLQGQLATEKEAKYGSKSAKKKPLGQSLNTDNVTKTPIGRRIGNTPGRSATSGGKDYRGNAAIPLNYVALQKDE